MVDKLALKKKAQRVVDNHAAQMNFDEALIHEHIKYFHTGLYHRCMLGGVALPSVSPELLAKRDAVENHTDLAIRSCNEFAYSLDVPAATYLDACIYTIGHRLFRSSNASGASGFASVSLIIEAFQSMRPDKFTDDMFDGALPFAPILKLLSEYMQPTECALYQLSDTTSDAWEKIKINDESADESTDWLDWCDQKDNLFIDVPSKAFKIRAIFISRSDSEVAGRDGRCITVISSAILRTTTLTGETFSPIESIDPFNTLSDACNELGLTSEQYLMACAIELIKLACQKASKASEAGIKLAKIPQRMIDYRAATDDLERMKSHSGFPVLTL